MSDLRYGRIVRVELLDPQGRNPKLRPAVVLTPTADITPDGIVRIAAITSDIGSTPADDAVELPWLGTGHPVTKLNRRSVAVSTWVAEVAVSTVRVVGTVPPRPLLELAGKVAARSAPASPPAAPPPPAES